MNRSLLVCTLLALALCALMPSTQSIWIDEAQTYSYASQPTLSAWWHHLRTDEFSEPLMPLGMLFAWVGGKLCGLSEWQLRFPNVIWMWIAVAAFAVLGRTWRVPWAPLAVAVQPFVWFYANEARPYCQQVAWAAVVAVAMIQMIEKVAFRPATLVAFLTSGGVLVGTSLFGVLTAAPAVLIVAALALRQRWSFPRWVMFAALSSLGWWLACGLYYLSVLGRGGKGAKLWDVGLQNIGFALYEFFGFAGFGPGRNDLRMVARSLGAAGALENLLPYAVPITLLGLLYLIVLLFGPRSQASPPAHRRATLAAGGVCLTAVAATLGLAFVSGFPFWGRHLAPVFPFASVLLISRLSLLQECARSWWLRGAGPLLLATLLASSLLLRFHPRHAKDDYRSAARIAHTALQQGQTVWWSADPQAAGYYGLAVSDDSAAPDIAHYLFNPSAPRLAAIPYPDLVVTSRPDVYDSHAALEEFLRDRSFRPASRFQGLQIWTSSERSESPK